MNDEQLLRYSRHILLDPIGIEGQERLLASRALVVGAGGLGCPAALYLAAAGVGTIVIADDDEVDLTNLQRQILHREHSVGRPKVDSARDALRELNPGCEVIPLKMRLTGDALMEQIAAADVVLDCSDNFATRHAINRGCVQTGTPLVSGAAIRFDGQIAVFDSRDDDAPCYHCLFPEADDVEEVRCAVMGVFAPLTGIVGTLQAAEALKLLARTGRSLAGRLLLLDALSMEWRSIGVPRDPGCAVCASPSRQHS
ncbi:HesA/MoeB/ThiF family protein [Methyloversatilis thermotolerans]|uniref:HesA/MoeB/ThiF family protein n=1 Tax=Methyloversatilis thermotolerans TaxID=1346290 RepID=UPI000381E104|nr:molybdopterin-synthase adenylyltransferase MoeB [Methyloversatilis thermotolerans]